MSFSALRYSVLLSVLLLISFTLSAISGDVTQVVINEIDTDNAGSDTQEFVELFGAPGAALDGLTLVFFNGSDDASYAAYDLDGVVLNAEGFAVIGNEAVPNVDLTFPNGQLQNGPDAVAVMYGNGDDFPNDTPIDLGLVMDAVVYVTDDDPDDGLMPLLNAGQLVVNESAGGDAAAHASARIPDGGIPQDTDTYIQQEPTPGYTNVLICDGGAVALPGEETLFTQACVTNDEAFVTVEFSSSTPDASYLLVVTLMDGTILWTQEELVLDFVDANEGTCYVYGLSYTGILDPESVTAGSDVNGIASDECVSLSGNFIEVEKVDCNAPTCDGGTVSIQGGETEAAICVNGENTVLFFEHNSDEEFVYFTYVLASEEGTIITAFDDEEYDFFEADQGTCYVWAFAYLGDLDETTTQPGMPLDGLAASECGDLSSNAVEVQKLECTGEGCTDLFISEYIEGSSQNKAIEIYNPTPFAVDLEPYVISTFNNGSGTPTNQLNLNGTLASGDVFVIAHSDAATPIAEVTDLVSAVSWFNGNDAIVLFNDGVAIDQLGIIGEDPGLAWDVNGVSEAMAEHTLVRNFVVTQGNTDWSSGQFEWVVYPVNDFNYIGDHSANSCTFEESPTISFTAENISVQEGNSVEVVVSIANPLTEVVADINYLGGTATPDEDFINDLPQQLVFPQGDFDPLSFELTTLDDLEVEGSETIELELTSMDGDVVVVLGNLTITILPSDQAVPLYEIGSLNQETSNGVADSLDVYCEIRGIAHGSNLNPAGLQFTLIDETGGIGVYRGTGDFGYTLTEGDSLAVVGTIEQFNGLTQMVADTVIYLSGGYPLMTPPLVNVLSEETESQLIQMKCIEMVDPSQWTNEAPGFNVDITDGLNVNTLRIDSDTDIFGTDAPVGVFTVTGIGGQFDSSDPYDSGYQLLPRYLDDLTEPVSAFFTAPDEWNFNDGAITFTDASVNGFDHDWDFGDGFSSEDESPTHTYAEPGIYTVTLTVSNEDGSCSDTYFWEINVIVVGVEERQVTNLEVYPNPASGSCFISTDWNSFQLRVYNLQGQVIHSELSQMSRTELHIGDWSAGMYLIEIQHNGEAYRDVLMVK